MKRSEMLKKIVETIDNACGNDGENRLYPSDEYLAYSILKTIEESGMRFCIKRDLGPIGNLWTPEGWEQE